MKRLFLFLSISLIIGISQTAFSLPLIPEIAIDSPLYFKFNNYEQISPSGAIKTPSGGTEQNWGILNMTSIAAGDLGNLPSGTVPDSQLFDRDGSNVFWAEGFSDGEITGIFYDIQKDNTFIPNATADIGSTGGFMDIYFDPNDDFSSAFDINDRTADDKYVGATEGTFLARIEFVNGAISAGNINTSIVGSIVPSPNGFTTGNADSFGNIVDINGDNVIDDNDGVWATWLDTNWFDTLLGDNTADIRFKNSYNQNANWNGPLGSDIAGATSDDPARAFSAVPEPATMLLLGIGLMGLAGVSRKNHNI